MKRLPVLVLGIFAFALFSFGVVGVNAQEESASNKKQGQEETKKQRCERVKERVETKTKKYEKSKNKYQNRYENIQGKLEGLVKRLQARNIDATDLETHTNEYLKMTKQFSLSHQNFEKKMSGVSKEACAGNKQGFENNVTQARKELQDMRENSTEINSYLSDVIKEDLNSILDEIDSSSAQ